VPFIQRFGSASNVNRHVHGVFLEGLDLDRTEAGLNPRFVKAEPPSDAASAQSLQKSRHRVIRTLRRRGYLGAEIEAAAATGDDPLRDNEPELVRAMAASVTQRIACGEHAGEQVRRIGSGLGYAGQRPARTGPRWARVTGVSLHANTNIPAHQRDQ
jgi:hypothetical protein